MTYEDKFGLVLGAFWIMFMAVIGLHWWQEAIGEDAAWVWSCHTMGDQQCGPGQPWITINIGGAD